MTTATLQTPAVLAQDRFIDAMGDELTPCSLAALDLSDAHEPFNFAAAALTAVLADLYTDVNYLN